MNKIIFTKDIFIKAINEIENQCNHDRKCSEAFKVLFPNDNISGYNNHWLQNQLIEILQIAMNDNHKDSWIEYYLWELDFGRKWEKDSVKIKGKNFKLTNAADLWELLNAINDEEGAAERKTDKICCGVLEKMQLGWMKMEDGTRCMPYIKGHSDDNMYRVNHCPSCGKYVSDVMVSSHSS